MTEARVFRALQDFYIPELASGYATGLTYTIRPENVRLAELAAGWAAAGLIEYTADPVSPTARVGGVAQVTRA